jgi:hypothetical protein
MTPVGRPFCRNWQMLHKRVPVMPEESTPGPSVQPAPSLLRPTPSPPPAENGHDISSDVRKISFSWINLYIQFPH